MCQEACLLPPLREVLLEAATAQNPWFRAPSLAHFPSLLGKFATVLSPSWVCRDQEKFGFFAFEKLESKSEKYPRGWIPK